MSNANDPAFPSGGCNGWGLTKREVLAGLAMAGLAALDGENYIDSYEALARDAVAQAHALLVELDKPQEQEPEADGN